MTSTDEHHALALDLQLAGGKHLCGHPLFAAGGHVVQLVVFLDQLFCCTVCRGAAREQIFTGQTFHVLVCRADGRRVDKGRCIGFGLVALALHDLAANQRMDECSHLAIALDNINVNAAGREGFHVGEKAIPQKRADRRGGANNLDQVPRLINAYFISHKCCPPYFRKMPRLRRGTSTSSTLTFFGSTRPAAKNSPVR